jgi:hypothetical protein
MNLFHTIQEIFFRGEDHNRNTGVSFQKSRNTKKE